MLVAGPVNNSAFSLTNVLITPHQRRIVLAAASILLAAFAATVPFADVQLPAFVSFNPSVECIVFANDLITAILLYAQYAVTRSRAILALAMGYLYTALIVIPHVLTFPGAFTGLLGGPQTSAWLYYFWSVGTPAAAIAYVLLGSADRENRATAGSSQTTIAWSFVLVAGLVAGITWLTTAGIRFLPSLMSGDRYSDMVVYVANPLAIVIAATAFAVLWFRRRSVLDYWLLLTMFSLILNYVVAAFLATQRFSLGFYASRGFTLISSMIVLTFLLREMMNLYTRLAHSNGMLERERNNRLMNIEAITASIVHEVKQPLTAITTNGSAARILLQQTPPDIAEARASLGDIIDDSHRIGGALDSIRTLVRKFDDERAPIDMNVIALDVLHSMRNELRDHGITSRQSLTAELPLVYGNRNQLRQVLLNLVHNAVEAMAARTDRSRVLQIRTELSSRNGITLAVQDSGPGVQPERLNDIFDAFVTTKPQGMGLGLAICRTIVERHGGQLRAASDGKTGALFQLVLPINSLGGGPG